MSEITQSTKTSASTETGFLNRKWTAIRFFFHTRAFESRLEGILRAAAGHEGNSLPAGDHRYHLLSTEADSLCTEFASRWGLDIDLLKARIAGLAKLKRLSAPQQSMNYARIAFLSLFVIPVLCLLVGAVAGLVSVGFHLAGGR